MERSRTQLYPRWSLPLIAVMAVGGVLAGSIDLIDGGHGWSMALVFMAAFPSIYVSTRILAIRDQGPDTRRMRILRSTGLVLGILSTLAAASCLYEGIMGTVAVWKASLGGLVAVSAVVVVWSVRRQGTVARQDPAPRER